MQPRHILIPLLSAAACGAPIELDDAQSNAILQSYTPQVGTCQWPSTVHLRTRLPGGYVGMCSGTMLRNRVVVTAAHCLVDNPDRITFYFGENANSGAESVAIDGVDAIAENCTVHPEGYVVDGGQLGDDGYGGSDIAVCKLPSQPGGLPEATPVTYGSCEASYLDARVRAHADFHLIGTGRSITNPEHTSHYGQKRHVVAEAAGWVSYTNKLHLKLWQPDPCADEDIVSGGDSGGSVMLQWPDGTWRLVAVLVAKDTEYNSPRCNGGAARFLLATPIANYLPWMEHETLGINNGFDLTRCHAWDQGAQAYEWHNDGFCAMQIYYTHPGETLSKSWDDFACFDVHDNVTPDFSGECAGWSPCGPFGHWQSCGELALNPSGGGGAPAGTGTRPGEVTSGGPAGGSTADGVTAGGGFTSGATAGGFSASSSGAVADTTLTSRSVKPLNHGAKVSTRIRRVGAR